MNLLRPGSFPAIGSRSQRADYWLSEGGMSVERHRVLQVTESGLISNKLKLERTDRLVVISRSDARSEEIARIGGLHALLLMELRALGDKVGGDVGTAVQRTCPRSLMASVTAWRWLPQEECRLHADPEPVQNPLADFLLNAITGYLGVLERVTYDPAAQRTCPAHPCAPVA